MYEKGDVDEMKAEYGKIGTLIIFKTKKCRRENRHTKSTS